MGYEYWTAVAPLQKLLQGCIARSAKGVPSQVLAVEPQSASRRDWERLSGLYYCSCGLGVNLLRCYREHMLVGAKRRSNPNSTEETRLC
jgi:hypothetical protein